MNQLPTFNFNSYNAKPDLIQCMIEDGQIQHVDYVANTRKIIGVTKEIYNELVEENEKHLNLLYENGILEKPKTEEEINNELRIQQNEMIKTMKEMQEQLRLIKEENNKLKEESSNGSETDNKLDINILP